MDRFAKSPGAGANDGYTSPRQNTCTYNDDFEYYYYPLYVDQIRDGVKDTPDVLVGPNGKYTILNKNIIHIKTENDLTSVQIIPPRQWRSQSDYFGYQKIFLEYLVCNLKKLYSKINLGVQFN